VCAFLGIFAIVLGLLCLPDHVVAKPPIGVGGKPAQQGQQSGQNPYVITIDLRLVPQGWVWRLILLAAMTQQVQQCEKPATKPGLKPNNPIGGQPEMKPNNPIVGKPEMKPNNPIVGQPEMKPNVKGKKPDFAGKPGAKPGAKP